MLNEVYPKVEMGVFTFYPSDILYDGDPIGYRVAASEYFDSAHRDNELQCFACDYPLDADQDLDFAYYPHEGEPIHGNKADCTDGE
jgi:hypothetical protein